MLNQTEKGNVHVVGWVWFPVEFSGLQSVELVHDTFAGVDASLESDVYARNAERVNGVTFRRSKCLKITGRR
ncbi:hypothetical protein JTE90_016009 [Oedothorax gibbosus]|nr:hypothetical protein JTE90_016009 [Oedothorax gibbosus]